jgi:hypothetical protein
MARILSDIKGYRGVIQLARGNLITDVSFQIVWRLFSAVLGALKSSRAER